MRRNRKSQWSRDLMAETTLNKSDFIMPLFIIEGINKVEEILSMPGVFRYTIDKLVDKVQSLNDAGICAIMLFPCVEQSLKSYNGDEALNRNNLICRAISEIKRKIPQIGVIADVALDPYTSHGFDGVLDYTNDVDNDRTIEILCKQSIVLAESGVDAVAPSDMMDGRVRIIRNTLESHKYHNTQIFSYAIKYDSSFYNPFRDAVGSKNNLGNRNKKTYFLDYRNSNEALKEISLDISEGADTIIIKPGLVYLDIISQASNKFKIPIFGYQVSGEYTILKNAAQAKLLNEKDAVLETLYSFKRAGATSIITYYADRVVDWI